MTNTIQQRNSDLVNICGFDGNLPGLVSGLSAECGEICDLIAKIEGWKKIKSTDKVDSLTKDLEGEIADVLVYLCQIASKYDIDIEQAHSAKIDKIKSRQFIN
jgi:NTP pyrophosphatase (non-canonical NTP hydrolase)